MATLEYICAAPECNTAIDPERWDRGKRTCDAKCRAAAFRARHGYRRVSDGGPVPVASEARSHASRSKPSGVQISYFKAVRILAARLVDEDTLIWITEADREAFARDVLREALPEKQRARVAGATRRKRSS